MRSRARAYRPGDIVKSRKGLFVEIDNTDAEGRLILADALTRAAEDEPELIVDFATLTGAARVALGPDLPAFFANQRRARRRRRSNPPRDRDDPIWRMPLWEPYDEMLKSDVADFANAAEFADGRLHHRGAVPETLRARAIRPGPISILTPGAIRPSRGARKAATRWGCRAIFTAFRRSIRATDAPFRRKIGIFKVTHLQHFASLPVYLGNYAARDGDEQP